MDKRILQKYPPNAENLLFALHDIQDAEKENYLKIPNLQSGLYFLTIVNNNKVEKFKIIVK